MCEKILADGRACVFDKLPCKGCGSTSYLVMSTAAMDEVCEGCGTWQDGVYGSAYERVG